MREKNCKKGTGQREKKKLQGKAFGKKRNMLGGDRESWKTGEQFTQKKSKKAGPTQGRGKAYGKARPGKKEGNIHWNMKKVGKKTGKRGPGYGAGIPAKSG